MDYIYVDNSNLYIEGRRVSAVAQGLAANIREAMDYGILDHGPGSQQDQACSTVRLTPAAE